MHTVRYIYGGISYVRECFASHPDRVFAMRISASEPGAVSFSVQNVIPFLREYNLDEGDGMGKHGAAVLNDNTISVSGKMDYYGILFENRLSIVTEGGRVKKNGEFLTVEGADSATVFFTCATNYNLSSDVFCEPEPSKKLEKYPAPVELVDSLIANAIAKG